MKVQSHFLRQKSFTEAEKIDADTPRPREDDDSGEGRKDQPAGVAAEEDDAVPEPGHVHLVGQPGKTWRKVFEEGERLEGWVA